MENHRVFPVILKMIDFYFWKKFYKLSVIIELEERENKNYWIRNYEIIIFMIYNWLKNFLF